MDYEIAVSPELDLTVEEFVAAWNDDPECKNTATAHSGQPTNSAYIDPVTMLVIPILVGVVSGVGANLLSDLIKRPFMKKGNNKPLNVQVIELPNSNPVIVVMPE